MEWDAYFMMIAATVAEKSHCLSHHYGAIAVDSDHCIIETGYNGPPRGFPHCNTTDIQRTNTKGIDGICPRRFAGFKSGEGLEHCPAAHAERNVLINAARHGHSVKGCTLYVTSPTPCRECSKEIVNAGIVRVVCGEDSQYPEKGLTGINILLRCGVPVAGEFDYKGE
jgi:dCMP deaminase